MIANLVISGKEDEDCLRFLALTPKRLSTARGERNAVKTKPSRKGM